MKTLQEYLFGTIEEANMALPPDAAQTIQGYFNAIHPDVKWIEKVTKTKFEQTNLRSEGTDAIGVYCCFPDSGNEAIMNDFTQEVSRFVKNPGKWTSRGRSYESAGRGYSVTYDIFVFEDGNVTYKLKFRVYYPQNDKVEMYAEAILIIVNPISITNAAELHFTPNTSDKTKDIAGRTIEVGDSVAYCSRAISGNSPMPVGVVTEVSSKQITVYDKLNRNIVKIPGFKCCVIPK